MARRATSRVRPFALVLALGFTLLGAEGAALAQDRINPLTGLPGTGRTLLNRNNGNRTGIGGVKARLPRPIGGRGSLLPPPPPRQPDTGPRPPRPPHHHTIAPGSRTNDNFYRHNNRGVVGDGISGRFDSDSGFRLRGDYSDDRFRLGFDLNPGLQGDRYRHGRHRGQSCYSPAYRYGSYANLWGIGGWGYYDAFDRYDNRYDYQPQTIVTQPVYIDASMLQPQQSAPAAPPRELTAAERGDDALYNGRVRDAITAYREHLAKSPNDASTMRSLAVALVQDKKVKEGVAVLALAYEQDRALVSKPMDPQMVAGGEPAFREVLRATVLFSNRMRSPSGYLAVVAMMQAEGRPAPALKILEKAKAAGLDEDLVTSFENELKR